MWKQLGILQCLFALCICSCDDNEMDYSSIPPSGYTAIQVESPSYTISAEGGECTIRVNHANWYFEHAKMQLGKNAKEYDWTNLVNLSGDWFILERMPGDGLEIPEREFSCEQILHCTFSPNETGQVRALFLTLRYDPGSSFHDCVDVAITQEVQ